MTQQGVDAGVRILDPAGKQIVEFDSPTGDSGVERARWIATVAGEWRVGVAPFEGQSSCPYEIELVERRAVEPGNERLVAADRLLRKNLRDWLKMVCRV